jgi:hypothetical protein
MALKPETHPNPNPNPNPNPTANPHPHPPALSLPSVAPRMRWPCGASSRRPPSASRWRSRVSAGRGCGTAWREQPIQEPEWVAPALSGQQEGLGPPPRSPPHAPCIHHPQACRRCSRRLAPRPPPRRSGCAPRPAAQARAPWRRWRQARRRRCQRGGWSCASRASSGGTCRWVLHGVHQPLLPLGVNRAHSNWRGGRENARHQSAAMSPAQPLRPPPINATLTPALGPDAAGAGAAGVWRRRHRAGDERAAHRSRERQGPGAGAGMGVGLESVGMGVGLGAGVYTSSAPAQAMRVGSGPLLLPQPCHSRRLPPAPCFPLA